MTSQEAAMTNVSMTEGELAAFIAVHPEAEQWRDSLWEEVATVTSVPVQVPTESASSVNGRRVSTLPLLQGDGATYHPGIGANPDGRNIYGEIFPAAYCGSGAGTRCATLRCSTPYGDDHPVGIFLRVWTAGQYAGTQNLTSTASGYAATDSRNATYTIKYRSNFGSLTASESPTRYGDSLIKAMGSEIDGRMLLVETERSAVFANEFGSLQIDSSVEFASPVYSTQIAIFVTVHFVYRMHPRLQGSMLIDWVKPQQDVQFPFMTSASGETLTFEIERPNVLGYYSHKADFVLNDEAGNPREDGGGIRHANSGELMGTAVNSFSEVFANSVFNDYPNSRIISGVVKLWTITAYEDTEEINNLNGDPVLYGFLLGLPENSDTRPVGGSVTASVVANGFGLSTLYVQNKTGIHIKMAQPTVKYGATAKRMLVTYYDGTAAVGTKDSDGGFTFTIDRLAQSGSLTFKVCVEDSRGLRSDEQTVTVSAKEYTAPALTSCSLYRADSNGTPNDNGDCAVIRLTASIASVSSKNSLTGIYVAILPYGTYMDWAHATEVNLKSKQNTDYMLAGELDAETVYRVRVRIVDKAGVTTTRYLELDTAAYTLHLKQGGRGVGIGEVARRDRTLSLADGWDVLLYGNQRLMNLIVPVGIVQVFSRRSNQTPVDPADLYPGTVWERLTDRFLMAASDPDDPDDPEQPYPAGETGGSTDIALLAANIPQLAVSSEHGGYAHRLPAGMAVKAEESLGGVLPGGNGTGIGLFTGTDYLAGACANKGNVNPAPIRHLPPYMAVDVWVRTA